MSKTLSSQSIVRDFLLEREENFEIASEIESHFSAIKIEIADKFVKKLIEHLQIVVPKRLGQGWTVTSNIERRSRTTRYFGIELNHNDWNSTKILAKPLLSFQQPNCNSMLIGIWKSKETQLPKHKIKETLDRDHRKGKHNRDWWPYYVIPKASDLSKNNKTARKICFHEEDMLQEIANEFITVATLVKDILNEMNS
jgi:hypothetical protein